MNNFFSFNIEFIKIDDNFIAKIFQNRDFLKNLPNQRENKGQKTAIEC
jgi:EAL domain-containing protein (putative c-di-GMP-specific phosphodiesterase class I)